MTESKLIGTTMYIGLSGELDERAAARVRSELDTILSGEGIKKVVLEMSQLKFMDSTGIGVLLGRYKRLTGRNIPIYLANPQKSVDKVLNLSGLYEIMPKVELKEEA